MRIPPALRGESAASTHFENVRGAKASPNGRTEYWYAVFSKANLRNRLWCGAIWMWKYASFKSTDANQSRGESAPGSASALTSWTDVRKALCWWVWDPKLGEAPHPSWVPRSSGCKTRSPARVVGLALLLLSRADSQSLASEPGHFEAMLETAPRHWNGVVCVWIEEYIPALSRWVANARFPE